MKCFKCGREETSMLTLMAHIGKYTLQAKPFCSICYPTEREKREKLWAKYSRQIDKYNINRKTDSSIESDMHLS